MKKARWFTLALLVPFLAIPAAINAGSPIGGIFAINTANYDQVHPAVAYNSQREEYLVVWHNEWPGNKDIYGQRVSKNGALVGNWFAISAGPGDRYYADVAYNSKQDEYLVVWEHDDGTRPNIRGQRVSATGQLQGGEMPLGTGFALRNRYTPAVAYAYTSDKYLVVWESFVQGSIASDIEGQALFSSGVLDGSNFLIAQGTWSESHDQPDLAYNRARNEFLVAWRRQNKSTGAYDIYGQRVKMAGGVGTAGPAFPIASQSKDEWKPAVAAIPKPTGVGQYLVAWEFHYSPTDRDIHARQVAGDGTIGSLSYIAITTADETSPAVAGNESAEQYLVVWTYDDLGLFGNGIFGRTVSTGNLLGETTVVGGTFGDHAAVASGWLGDFLVAFNDFVSDQDIYGRLWGNTAPTASFTVNPSSGDTNTVFQFDASSSSDAEDPTSALEVRWDWRDDGTWDTGWDTTKTVSRQFPIGTHTVRLEVKDTDGLTDTTTRQVTVSAQPGMPYHVYVPIVLRNY